jgi:hypothetical protein
MNDLFVWLWGEDWPSYLIMLFVFALFVTVLKSFLKRWPPWRAFWLSRKFSEEDLQSATLLIHFVKINRMIREGRLNAFIPRHQSDRTDEDSD